MMNQSSSSGHSRSLFVVSKREAFAEIIREVFPEDENTKVTNSSETFTAMNGRAVTLAFDHDAVILEADPDDESEMQAIGDLLSQRSGETVFVALTKSDVSIAKARTLQDIGIDEVLPLSIDGDGLRAAVEGSINARQVPMQSTYDGAVALGKIVPVTQSRGGAGATTVAVNLACALSGGRSSLFRKANRARVALLDFDVQFGNANVFLDLEDKGGFLQIIEAVKKPDEHFISSAMQSHASGVDVLCAPSQIIPLNSPRVDLIEAMLDILKQRYDYIVIDLPRAVVDWVEPILNRADQLILVTDTSVPCVRQCRRLVDLFREDNVGLAVEFVVNRDKRPVIKSDHIREAEKILETKFNHWLPDNPKLARHAVNVGQPIVDKKPRSDLGKAFAKLTAAVSAEGQKTKRSNV